MSLYCVTGMLGEKKEYDLKNKKQVYNRELYINPYSFYYKALNGQAPSYISDLLTKYKPSRNLRSGTKHLLTVPRSNTKSYGDRSFQVAAAELFNKLPIELLSFKKLLFPQILNLRPIFYRVYLSFCK